MSENYGMLAKENLRGIKFVHDTAIDGLVQGAVIIRLGSLPTNALIMGGAVWVDTAYTSLGSATLALSVEGANDILTATAVASLTAGAVIAVAPVIITAATWVKTSASVNRGLTATIATADMLTGKLTCWLYYTVMS
jgi:hypothetical protein